MSRMCVNLVDRPPEGAAGRVGARKRFWRALLVAGSVLVLLAGSVAAQDHPRTDPGVPPDPGGAAEGWLVLNIPGLPAGAVLGDVWVAPNGDVYLWAKYPPDRSSAPGTLDEPLEGDRLPNRPPGTPKTWSSSLYRYDGVQWTVMLRTPGETGVALTGYGNTDLFASTTSPVGEARLYHLSGGHWVQEELPGYFLGRLHTMLNTANGLFFKVDRVILHHDGVRILPIFELPGDESAERGMVAIGDGSLVVMSGDCHYLFDNGAWSCVDAGFAFGHVEDAWGMRDANGQLQMYAIGDDGDNSGLKVWKFLENDPVLHDGTWVPTLLDPASGHTPDIGSGYHLWGNARNDVYATGVVNGEGHMLRFNGTAWVQLSAPMSFGTIHGVWSAGNGVVWFSTESGQLVRYARPNSPPDVSAALPSISRLWPANGLFTAVDILGVTDPEGDAFSLRIDRVLSDEDPATVGVVGNCPDARIVGSRALLRAEHNPNGDGRTYQLEFTATDQLGLSSVGFVNLCAPHFETTPCDVDPAVFDALGPCAVPATERRPFEADDRNGALWVKYELGTAGPVHLGIFDVAGRLRGTIEEGDRAAGVHETSWDLDGLDAGVYFVKLRTSGPAVTKRVVVLR